MGEKTVKNTTKSDCLWRERNLLKKDLFTEDNWMEDTSWCVCKTDFKRLFMENSSFLKI